MVLPAWIIEAWLSRPGITSVTAVATAAVGVITYRRSLLWKRSELASSFLKELNQNQELSFACRCLDWRAGKFVVPDNLQPLLSEGDRTIEHDPEVLGTAMRYDLTVAEMSDDPRLQIYRTAMDTLLSWLSVVHNSIDRDLFGARDLPGVGYWVDRLTERTDLDGFISRFGYADAVSELSKAFRQSTRGSRPRKNPA